MDHVAATMKCLLRLLVVALAAATTLDVSAAAEPAEETAGKPATFDVWEFQVVGNRLLDDKAVERIVYNFLGPSRTIDDVEAARTALEAAYHDAGYGTVLVNLPEQDVVEGLVRLDVVEGKVERVHVTGSRYFSLGRIRTAVPALAQGATPNVQDVQRQIAEVNRLTPDRAIVPSLSPGRRPGGVEVELKVKDQLPLHGSVELNDQYQRDTTRTRLTTALRYDNLWQRAHSFGLSFQTTPEDTSEIQILSGSYSLHPGDGDSLLALYGVKSDSNLLTLASGGGGVGVVGNGWVAGARWFNPIMQGSSVQQNVSLGLDYKDFKQNLSTPISFTKFVAGYGLNHLGDRTAVSFNVETDLGVRALGNEEKEFSRQRVFAEPNFVSVIANGRVQRTLPADATVALSFAGQLSSGPLVPYEQFSLGGASSVRGYLETQVLADDAVQGTLELASPPLARWIQREWLGDARMFVFGDAARGRLHKPLKDDVAGTTLASVGVGVRLASPFGIESSLLWAWPLVENDQVRVGESRFHFRFAYGF